ncbi:MAG TPA: NAD(P)-dependent oxidoreductase [Puia sp.]|nr:NAD(P)-dependent oxidoreductase [Puia sp.]
MKILVTGAYGFLGRNISKVFKQSGHTVVGIGHGKWQEEEFTKWGVDTWVESTITFEALINININFDIIVHCGGSGSVGYSIINPYEDFQKSVQSTLAVLEFIRLKSPYCKFIYPSSVAVQGNLPDEPIKETILSTPASPYGFHKKIAEDLCRSYHLNYNITVGILRFFSVYGVGLQKQLLYEACKKMTFSESKEVVFWGTGEETRDWIYVDDAAKLTHTFASRLNGLDIINCGSGIRTGIREVLELLKEKMGLPIKISFSGESRKGDPKHFWADVSKALNYGWQPGTSLGDGLDLYVKYFKSLIPS